MTGLLFVGGLPLHACDQNLTRYFRRFGPLDSAEVQRRSTGRSKGYAFLKMSHPADALKVLSYPTTHVILGKTVTVQSAEKPSESFTSQHSRSNRTILLDCIPFQLRQQDLVQLLYKIGPIESVSAIEVSRSGTRCCTATVQTYPDYLRFLETKVIPVNAGNEILILAHDKSTINVYGDSTPVPVQTLRWKNSWQTGVNSKSSNSKPIKQMTFQVQPEESTLGSTGRFDEPVLPTPRFASIHGMLRSSEVKIRPGLSITVREEPFPDASNYRFVLKPARLPQQTDRAEKTKALGGEELAFPSR